MVDCENRIDINVDCGLLKEYMNILYACNECNYVFTTKKTFYEHSLQHFIEKKANEDKADAYLCSECFKSFNSIQETKVHMKAAHKNVKVKLGTDEKPTVKEKTKYKWRKKEKLPCPFKSCKVSFDREGDLAIHLKCHVDGNTKTFCCPECAVMLPSWPKCAMHLYKAHSIDCSLLKCPACETYRAWAPLTLENHMRVHSDLKAFVCPTCSDAFKQASQLRNHIAVHNNDPSFISNKRKQCNVCFKMYSDSKALKKHKNEVHNRLRPFVCNVCGHASARKHLLLLHQRQHTGQKTRTCNFCSFKTADHNSLRRHLMRHTGVRSYFCPECSFTTIRSSSFKEHVLQQHPESSIIFNCAKCPYKTVSEDNYVRHISDHLTGLIKDPDATSGESVSIPEELAKKFPAWVPDSGQQLSVSNSDPTSKMDSSVARAE